MNIEQATLGNADSQWLVARSIQACRTAPRSMERIEEMRRSGGFTSDFITEVEQHHHECVDLLSVVANPGEDYTRWLRKAAEGGSALAKSTDALLSYPNFEVEEMRVLIKEALKTNDPDALFNAVMFYATVTPDSNYQLHEAWWLLSCEKKPNCSLEAERARQRREYRLPEVLEIDRISNELREKIRQGMWDDLGF